jgi:hypothetical protein
MVSTRKRRKQGEKYQPCWKNKGCIKMLSFYCKKVLHQKDEDKCCTKEMKTSVAPKRWRQVLHQKDGDKCCTNEIKTSVATKRRKQVL